MCFKSFHDGMLLESKQPIRRKQDTLNTQVGLKVKQAKWKRPNGDWFFI